MKKGLQKLKEKWEEDPVTVLFVGALCITATAKLVDARSNAVGRKTWEREVARREWKERGRR